MNRLSKITGKACLATVFFLVQIACMAQYRIGVITDLPQSEYIGLLVDSVIHQIDETTGVNQDISSPQSLRVFNIASQAEARAVYQNFDADLVLSIGGVSTKGLSKISNLSIPVIGLGVIDPHLQNIPYSRGKSGKKNFTYILTTRDLISEISSFQKIAAFDDLTILNDPVIGKSIDPLQGKNLLDSLNESLGIAVKMTPATEDVSKVIEQIGKPSAIYLSPLLGKNDDYVKAISDYLIEHDIPSFSSSRQHVDLGILGCSSGENGPAQVIRRIAIVADGIISGTVEASDNDVALNIGEDIFLNIATAKKLQLSPPFEILLTVNLVGNGDAGKKEYSFNEIAELAIQKNFDLKISYQDIDLAELDIKSNRALILPDLTAGLTGVQINEERANAAINSPEKSLSLDLVLTQVIYSEEALAAIKISRYLKKAAEYQTESDVLDLLLDTYSAYLNVLSAKTNLDIQRQNLENSRTNLELAKIRVDVGSANNSDLFRWESEVANATQTLIEAQASLLSVKLQLNNLLANSLERDFEVKDIGLEDELFRSFKNSPVSNLIATPRDLNRASDFLLQESFKRNPNKKLLLENINAAERQLKLNKRLFYVPTISLQAQGSEILARGGEGSEDPDPGMPSFGTGLQDNSWSVAATLTYPIFTGFNRKVNKQISLIQLEQLEYSNQSLDQALDLSIRTSSVSLLSFTTNLKYSKISAENAAKNFELVQSNYREGTVNITQLIDAQEAALSANLQEAISVYDYIFANLQLEYSVGFFSMFLTEEEIVEFNQRFIESQKN